MLTVPSISFLLFFEQINYDIHISKKGCKLLERINFIETVNSLGLCKCSHGNEKKRTELQELKIGTLWYNYFDSLICLSNQKLQCKLKFNWTLQTFLISSNSSWEIDERKQKKVNPFPVCNVKRIFDEFYNKNDIKNISA